MTRYILLAAVLTAGAGAAVAAWPQQHSARPDGEEGRGPQGLKARLGLTEDQQTHIRDLRRAHQREAIRRRADLRIAHMDLEGLLGANTVDRKAVDAKIKEISDLEQAGLRSKVDMALAIRDVLTPEQRAKWKELREERGERAGRRGPRMHRQGRPGPPDGPGGPGPDAQEGDREEPFQQPS